MKKNYKHYALIISLLSVFSCDNDSSDVQPMTKLSSKEEILIPATASLFDEKSMRVSTPEEIIAAEEFAKLLASSLKDQGVRKFIKDEANKIFDGDFDILVSRVVNSKIGDVTFSEKIKQNSVGGITKGNEVFENAIKNPKLNIAVPILIEKWDTSKQPLVAVALGVSEKGTEYLKAFDSNGNSYLIDANLEPNVPVIVVGNNERMNYKPEVNSSTNLRTSGNFERITYLKCPNLSDIESWYFGAPEIRFDGVVYNNDFSAAFQAFSKTQNPSRSKAKDGYTLNQELFGWYFDENHGPDYYLQTWEIDDSGSTYKLTVGVTAGKKDVASGTAAFEISYTAEDKKLPGELIHYTSPSPRTITDSYLEFTLVN